MNKNYTKTEFDKRDITFINRINIGYSNLEKNWQSSPAFYTNKDLKISGHPVMEDWETNYMELLAKICTKNGGKILEVGFGMGISASFIQEQPIEGHQIIEANSDVFSYAKLWQNDVKIKTNIILGFWEDLTKNMQDESFDGILFDTYPLKENEIHTNHFPFFKEAYRLLKPRGVLTYYSDEITDFSKKHLDMLKQAGFEKIDKVICNVNPPNDCQYWTSNTILAPIIIK